MAYDVPDEADAAFVPQARLFSTDLDVITAGMGATGVISGCAVTAQGSPDMTVAVAAGVVLTGGVLKSVSSGNVTISAADGTNPRIDAIVADSSGAKQRRGGTAAASPRPPVLTAGDVALAFVYVPAADTAINSNQIVDKRVGFGVRPYFVGCRLGRDPVQSVSVNTETAIEWNSEEHDPLGMHDNSTNPSRLTIPTGYEGWWDVKARARVSAATADDGYSYLKVSGSIVAFDRIRTGSGDFTIRGNDVCYCTAGQYIEFFIAFSGAGPKDVGGGASQTGIIARYIGPSHP